MEHKTLRITWTPDTDEYGWKGTGFRGFTCSCEPNVHHLCLASDFHPMNLREAGVTLMRQLRTHRAGGDVAHN